jgi:hypothetical protein
VETSIFPLRTVVGRALPVASANLLGHSDLLDASQIRIALRTSRQEAEADTVYRDLHPAAWFDASGAAPLFGAEVRTYRVPADLPVDVPAQFAGLFVLGPEVADLRDSRRLWAEFSLELADPEDKACPQPRSRRGTAAAPRSASRARPPGTPCRPWFLREFDDNRRISVTEDTLHCEEPSWRRLGGGLTDHRPSVVGPPSDC